MKCSLPVVVRGPFASLPLPREEEEKGLQVNKIGRLRIRLQTVDYRRSFPWHDQESSDLSRIEGFSFVNIQFEGLIAFQTTWPCKTISFITLSA